MKLEKLPLFPDLKSLIKLYITLREIKPDMSTLLLPKLDFYQW